MSTCSLIMLGTGNAAVTRCYNTCFALRNGTQFFLTDGGGGNGILARLEQAQIPLAGIHDIFLTHTHTDHIFGVVWVVRMIAQGMNAGKYAGELRVYGHVEGLQTLEMICRGTLPGKVTAHFGKDIHFVSLLDGEPFSAAGMQGVAFDIGSTKARQFGYRLLLPDGQSFVCLGDEPYNERAHAYAYGADWLLCEAFCLYADRERFKPYEKHHATVKDACELAERMNVKNLVIWHSEEETLDQRQMLYAKEGREYYLGDLYVPKDGDVIPLN